MDVAQTGWVRCELVDTPWQLCYAIYCLYKQTTHAEPQAY